MIIDCTGLSLQPNHLYVLTLGAMICDRAEACIYYRTYRYRPDSRQSRLLIESYCEGSLRAKCRRIQYGAEFQKEAPPEMAPNGYQIGTHKKFKADNTRKYPRYTIENGTCLLELLETRKTLSAEIRDISEGGIRLELNVDPEELGVSLQESRLKILGYTIENEPFPLTREVIKTIWQNQQVIGCCFVPAPA